MRGRGKVWKRREGKGAVERRGKGWGGGIGERVERGKG